MIGIEVHLGGPDGWLLGMTVETGRDPIGEYKSFAIGILFFSIAIVRYYIDASTSSNL